MVEQNIPCLEDIDFKTGKDEGEVTSQCIKMEGNNLLQTERSLPSIQCQGHGDIISQSETHDSEIQDDCTVTTQCTSDALNDLVIPAIEEVNYVEYKEELVANQHALDNKESMDDNIEHNHAARCKLKCCAGTLVIETGPADDVAVDCSEGASAFNTHDNNAMMATICCINRTPCYECTSDSEEETNIRKTFVLSQKQDILQSNDISDNEASHCSSHRRNVTYSNYYYKAKIVEYNEINRAGKQQDHQLTLSHPSSSENVIQQESLQNTIAVNGCKNELTSPRVTGCIEPLCPILVGNFVKVYPTSLSASLPQHDKFLVKERQNNPTIGFTKSKLVLKSCSTKAEQNTSDTLSHQQSLSPFDDDDDNVISAYYRQNRHSPGQILYTRDRRFNGRTKYPLPNGRAVSNKIGKGGNGFVFTMYHERKQYAVKKTTYRSNEVNVHSALKHKNILPLLAVLMGEKHERHHGKFYCFHFMPQIDCDLRQILSAEDIGCMKYFYHNCSKDPTRWEKGFNNIKFVLSETLKALAYLHNNGYVHRDVKASNIMIKIRCHCRPLECSCSSRFQVKLGDFDSAGTVPGLGITEPTDQVIKFASILPLGTPGYRAPEVSMHIVLSGPYETLYTTAVDMWSFGSLCLNICIGKTAALKQREEASLLLSRTHTSSTELWEKTTKINELKQTKPFSNDPELIRLIGSCLQVNNSNRPSAKEAKKMLCLQ